MIRGGRVSCRVLRSCQSHLRPATAAITVTVTAAITMEASQPGDQSTNLDHFGERCNHSWVTQLVPDPGSEAAAPNKTSREVKSGHYVLVMPTPLPDASLVIHSAEMAASLGLSQADCASDKFVQLLSGHVDAIPGFQSFATPYALSIYGQEMYQNCPFGNGNGYGDGRAISLGEVIGQAAGERETTPHP
jgi:hypothetical protein